MRVMNKMADRLLELFAPHTAARATDCDYQCCSTRGTWKYCCYYPNGTHHCGGCVSTSSCR